MKATLRLLLLTVFLFPLSLHAQSNELLPCATRDGKSDWLIQYQKNPEQYRTLNDTLHVPLTIYLVGTDEGTGFFGEKAVRQQVCQLNSDFQESAIQFYIKGEVQYISNSVYNNHNFGQGAEMMSLNRVESTINCYIVDSPAGACGYSSYNLGVALNESCIGPDDHTWAHELGHYLSLPHTFLGWEGFNHDYDLPAPVQINNFPVERVDGLNCEIAGDGFCDTPPDYLNYRWFCPSDGFSVTQQLDPDSVAFVADGTYFMSYSGDNCMERFSPDQIAAMRANVLDEKADHLNQDTPLGPVEISDFTPVSPEIGAFLDDFNSTVEFAWEPIPNATNYKFELSIFPNFTLIIFNEETTESQVTVPDVPPNYDLYWRVTAYNNWRTCEVTSESASFSTGGYSAVQDIAGLNDLTVFPNPVQGGSSLVVAFDLASATDASLELLDLSGKVLVGQEKRFTAGTNQEILSTTALAPGVYFLRMRSEQGIATRKVIVTR